MKTYYNDTPRKIAFENKSIGLQEAKDYFLALTDDTASYIGFIDVYDDVIIFKWLGRNKWLVDHPIVTNTLHRQRYATNKDCLALIEKVYQEEDVSAFKGFEDVPVGEFTLDEILEFKREDELLLKEEDPDATTIIKKAATEPIQKKPKAKTSINMGETLNVKAPRPETIVKKIAEKTIKDKPADNGSFFQL